MNTKSKKLCFFIKLFSILFIFVPLAEKKSRIARIAARRARIFYCTLSLNGPPKSLRLTMSWFDKLKWNPVAEAFSKKKTKHGPADPNSPRDLQIRGSSAETKKS